MRTEEAIGEETDARVIQVAVESDVARAWQEARDLVVCLGFSRPAAHYIATGVSELGQNLVLHATDGGVITVSPILRGGKPGVEITSEDCGPGIADVAQAMEDGYSTRGGLGAGLPAVRRLMDEFEITSAAGTGTRVVARMWRR